MDNKVYTSESFQNLSPREYLDRSMAMLETIFGRNVVGCIYGGTIRDVLNNEHPQDIDVKLDYFGPDIQGRLFILQSVGVWKPNGKSSTEKGMSGELCGVPVDFNLPSQIVHTDFRCNQLKMENKEIRGLTFDVMNDIRAKRLVSVNPIYSLEELVDRPMTTRAAQSKIIQRGRKMMARGWTWDYPFPETFEAGCCVSHTTEQCIKMTCNHTISLDAFIGVLGMPNPRCPLCRKVLGFSKDPVSESECSGSVEVSDNDEVPSSPMRNPSIQDQEDQPNDILPPDTPVWVNNKVCKANHIDDDRYHIHHINRYLGCYLKNEFQVLVPAEEWKVKIDGVSFTLVRTEYIHPDGVVLSRNRFVPREKIIAPEECIGRTIRGAGKITRFENGRFVTDSTSRINGVFESAAQPRFQTGDWVVGLITGLIYRIDEYDQDGLVQVIGHGDPYRDPSQLRPISEYHGQQIRCHHQSYTFDQIDDDGYVYFPTASAHHYECCYFEV